MSYTSKILIYKDNLYIVADPPVFLENGTFILTLNPETRLIFTEESHYRYLESKIFKVVRKSKDVYALHPITDSEYLPVEHVGKGTYGTVSYYPTEKVLIKKTEDSVGKDFIKEVAAYRLLASLRCLPTLYGFNKGTLAMEKGSISLRQFLKRRMKNPLSFIKQICYCFFYISQQGIINCDIKPDNIVLLGNKIPFIIDWGILEIDRTFEQKMEKNTVIQTLWYRAPEIAYANITKRSMAVYNYKVDVWSLGCILYEMVTEKYFMSPMDIQDYWQYMFKLVKIPDLTLEKIPELLIGNENLATRFISRENVPDEITYTLLCGMLDLNPNRRFTYEQILKICGIENIKQIDPDLMPFPHFRTVPTRFRYLDRILEVVRTPAAAALAIQMVDYILHQGAEIKTDDELKAIINIAVKLRGNFNPSSQEFPDLEYETLKLFGGNLLFHTLYDKGIIKDVQNYSAVVEY